jgi:hypothetical protein
MKIDVAILWENGFVPVGQDLRLKNFSVAPADVTFL